jgi:hypothetical protein
MKKLFPFALGEAEADFKTVQLVFLVDVLDEGLEVFGRFGLFGGFSGHIESL